MITSCHNKFIFSPDNGMRKKHMIPFFSLSFLYQNFQYLPMAELLLICLYYIDSLTVLVLKKCFSHVFIFQMCLKTELIKLFILIQNQQNIIWKLSYSFVANSTMKFSKLVTHASLLIYFHKRKIYHNFATLFFAPHPISNTSRPNN